MTEGKNKSPTIDPYATGLEGLDGHLLKDLWGVTPDQFAVARGLADHHGGLGLLPGMGRQDRMRVQGPPVRAGRYGLKV